MESPTGIDAAALGTPRWQSRCEALVREGFVAPDPEQAYRRLAEAEEDGVDIFGAGCEVLNRVRTSIHRCDSSGIPHYLLMLVAPHTHWDPGPILETWDPTAERYWIGPLRACSGLVFPISFVITADGPLAYEWAAEGAFSDPDSLAIAYDLIDRVAHDLADSGTDFPIPVGLSVNHRFKRIGGPGLFATMEIPDPSSGMSYVEANAQIGTRTDVFEGQVGWPVSVPEKLSRSRTAAFAFLNDELAKAGPAEAAEIFQHLSSLADRA